MVHLHVWITIGQGNGARDKQFSRVAESLEMPLRGKGDQNKSPQDEPYWHGNYFKTKATKTLWAHEKFYLSLK